jgi:hypothetical protein
MSGRKDAYYFPHDANARSDEKIVQLRIRLGWEGYGLYWAFLEICRDVNKGKNKYSIEAETAPQVLAVLLGIHETLAQDFVNCCLENELLTVRKGRLLSVAFVERMEAIEAKRLTLKENGRRGGLAKARAKAIANATEEPEQTPSKKLPIKGKERKEKETNNNGLLMMSDIWLERWGDELRGIGIETPQELEESCNRNGYKREEIVGALLQVADMEAKGDVSTNRAARVKSIIKHGIGSAYRKKALEPIQKRPTVVPFVPPSEEELEAGRAETVAAAREFRERLEKKRGGE